MLNYSKITQETGLAIADDAELLYYVQSVLDWLATHNKNYTKEQNWKISTLKDIFNALGVE